MCLVRDYEKYVIKFIFHAILLTFYVYDFFVIIFLKVFLIFFKKDGKISDP